MKNKGGPQNLKFRDLLPFLQKGLGGKWKIKTGDLNSLFGYLKKL